MKKITKKIHQLTSNFQRQFSNLVYFWRRQPKEKLSFGHRSVNNKQLTKYQKHAIREINRHEISTMQIVVIIACAIFLVLPFISTFEELITSFVMKIQAYQFLQDQITPELVKMVTALLNALGITSYYTPDHIFMNHGSEMVSVFISWNCIGWQSVILLVLTFFVGLQGPFTLKSKIETILIGILGTILINVMRISFITLVAYYFGQLAAIVFHDYVSTLVMILWLVSFWLLSYRFILHHKDLAYLGHH
jgi:exosortase/archaeosortase family protein